MKTQVMKGMPTPMARFRLDEVVRVLRAPAGQNQWVLTGAECGTPRAGDLGTVIEVYAEPREAYCIKAVGPNGQTNWLLDFLPDEIEPL